MPTLSSGLSRTALALKVGQIKLATWSYLRDRTGQATSTVTAYAIAAGLFAAAGIFLIVACLARRCSVGSNLITGCFRLSEPLAHYCWWLLRSARPWQ